MLSPLRHEIIESEDKREKIEEEQMRAEDHSALPYAQLRHPNSG
jgi:hypothetical protein